MALVMLGKNVLSEKSLHTYLGSICSKFTIEEKHEIYKPKVKRQEHNNKTIQRDIKRELDEKQQVKNKGIS